MAAPPPPFGTRSRPAVKWAVFLGDSNGNRPTIWDQTDWLKPQAIHLATNAHFNSWDASDDYHTDTIELSVITAKAGIRVQDLGVPLGYHRIVEVRQADDNGEFTTIIGWGMLSKQAQDLSRTSEMLRLTVRLDWFLFGNRLRFYLTTDSAGLLRHVESDIVFNPLIDGQLEGNRSDKFDIFGNNEAHVFLSPESMRSDTAIAIQGQDRSLWDLPTAILSLCWLLNPFENHITNPTLAELQAVITDTSTRLLKNVRVPLGSSLPGALNAVCHPLGYRWFTESFVDTTDPDLPVKGTYLRFFKLGAGIQTDLKCQRVGETITSDETNLADYSASIDITTPNVVTGRGSFIEREGTFPLVPGWPAKYDNTSLEDINSRTLFDETDRLTKDVLRFWVLNEAGDHGGENRAGVNSYTDLAPLFGSTTRIVRRRFHPCLTKSRTKGGQALWGSGGVYVEWNNNPRLKDPLPITGLTDQPLYDQIEIAGDVSDKFPSGATFVIFGSTGNDGTYTVNSTIFAVGTTTISLEQPLTQFATIDGNVVSIAIWQPLQSSWSVADKEAGISLDGTIGKEMFQLFRDRVAAVGPGGPPLEPTIRVTACLASDTRLTYTAARRPEAPHGEDIPLHLDVDDRFHDRLVQRGGPFQSRWASGNYYDITNLIDQPVSDIIEVPGDISDRLPVGSSFVIRGSTGNDGRYTVVFTVFAAGITQIAVKESLTQFTVFDGQIGVDTDEAADLPALQRFCIEARDVHDGARVNVSASLKGHDHPEYRRGNLIKQVQPRNLLLNNYNAAAPFSRYPQIVGLNYHFGDDSQRTELILEVPDAERPELNRSRA